MLRRVRAVANGAILLGLFLAVLPRVDAFQLADQSNGTPEPELTPAITGNPGVFAVETGEVLPKGTFAASAYLNMFSRPPGSVTILGQGLTLSAGLTSRITAVARFEPYQHVQVGLPSQLSLNQPATCLHDVFDAPIFCEAPTSPGPPRTTPPPNQSSWKGPAAAFVQGFPYVAGNTTDYGPLALGFKVNLWSETRRAPVSVSLGLTLNIPTESAAAELARHGTQDGTLDYSFTLGISKTFRHGVILATDVNYILTSNPKANGQTLYTPGDQIIFGQGFIFPLRRRLQFLTEYTVFFPQEGHTFGLGSIDTQNTSWGPNMPVDGVWGVRVKLQNGAALDLGYRYMLNLHQVKNRSGFVVQVSDLFGRKN